MILELVLSLSLLADSRQANAGSEVVRLVVDAPSDGGVLAITPAQLPPTRTRLLFDRIRGSDAGTETYSNATKAIERLSGNCAERLEVQPLPEWGARAVLSDGGLSDAGFVDLVDSLVSGKIDSVISSPGSTAPSKGVKSPVVVRKDLLDSLEARRAGLLTESDAKHVEVEWDPTVSRPLTRMAPLEGGGWQVSLVAQPAEFQPAPYSNAAWTVLCPSNGSGPEALIEPDGRVSAYALFQVTPEALYGAFSCARDRPTGWRAVPLSFEWVRRLEPRELLAGFGAQGESRTPIGSVPRAFGLEVEKVASDAFQAVADVAVVRAQQATLDIARKVIVNRLCDEWAPALVARLSPGALRGTPFARSCEVLRAINPSSIGTLGATLKKSLAADALELAVNSVSDRLVRCLQIGGDDCGGLHPNTELAALAPALAGLAAVVASGYFDSASTLPRAQALIASVVQQARPRGLTLHDRALIALAYCYRVGNCDSNTVRNVIRDPDHFLGGFIGRLPETQVEHLGDMVSFVTHGMSVMQPHQGDDAQTHVRNTLRFGKGLAELALQSSQCERSTRCAETAGEISGMLDVLFSVADQDPVRLLVMLGGLLVKVSNAQTGQAGVAMLTALATYAETYETDGRGLTPEQQRDRRAQAVSALADLAKQREFREGDWPIAFGAWVGIRADASWGPRDTQWGRTAAGLQLSVPFGITLEHRLGRDHGLWFALSFADVAAYTRVATCPEKASDDCKSFRPSYLEALSFGAAAGYLFADDFVAVLDIRLQPYSSGDLPRLGVGLSINYNLPVVWLH